MLIEIVVCQLEFVKRQRLPHKLRTFSGRILVFEIFACWMWIGFAARHPFRVVIFIAAIVDGHNVHYDPIVFVRFESGDADFDGWKHSPVRVYEITFRVTNSM